MTDYGEGLNSALRGVVCLIVSSSQLAGSFLKGIGSGDPSLPGAANALRRSICNAGPSDDLDDLPGEFSGGQCPGRRYRVFTRSINTVGVSTLNPDGEGCGIPEDVENNPLDVMLGPIAGLRRVVTGPASSSSVFTQYFIQASNGEFNTGGLIEGPSCPTSGKVITSVIPFDGQPDDCGNPPPPPWPPEGNTYDIDFTYTDNTNTTVNVEGDTTIFAPIVNLSGQILVPITVNISPEISLSGTIEISPNFEVNLNPEFTIGGRGGDKPTIEDPSDPQPPEPIDEPEDEPAEPPIVGVVVVSDASGNRKASQVFKGNQPDLYVPRLGTCSFAIKVGSVIAWTNDIPIKNTNCFIPCPYPPGAIDVRCEPELDSQVTFQVNPIRGNPCLCD